MSQTFAPEVAGAGTIPTTMANGGVQGGRVYGKTDKGISVTEDGVSVPDLNATIAYALGLPLDLVLYSPSKRPFTVSDKGKPITTLFS